MEHVAPRRLSHRLMSYLGGDGEYCLVCAAADTDGTELADGRIRESVTKQDPPMSKVGLSVVQQQRRWTHRV